MSLVKSFTHLKGRPHEEKALPFLQRVASLVKPIMRKHNWTLPVLAEFFPENDSLVGLNVNKGQKILLRLRPAWAPDTFYDEEQVILVMLHELTHNVHGPHDEKFYKFLAELEKEYEDLKRSGYSGEGFHGKGSRLGVGVSHDVPIHLGKAKALEAAEKRRRVNAVLGGGGSRLGGRATIGKTPRELAAEAAERRARDEKACGTGLDAQREADRTAKDSIVSEVIDLTSDGETIAVKTETSPPASPDVVVLSEPTPSAGTSRQARQEGEPPLKKRILSSNSTVSVSHTPRPVVSSSASSSSVHESRQPISIPAKAASSSVFGEWECKTCTLINQPLALQCDACLSERPRDLSIGWTCLACGESGMEHQFWTCRVCGTVKKDSSVVA